MADSPQRNLRTLIRNRAADARRTLAGVSRRSLILISATLALGLVGSKLLQDLVADNLINNIVANQTVKVSDHIRDFEVELRQAEISIRRYASLISNAQSAAVEDQGRFDLIAQQDRDGAWRTPKAWIEQHNEAAVWIPQGITLSDDDRQFFARVQTITTLFGQGAETELLADTWTMPLTAGIVIFWPERQDFVASAPADFDYRPTPWVQLTDPAVNPRGEARWTDPEFDPIANDWMVSVVAPFQRDGHWGGSVGHDIVIRTLLRNLFAYNAVPGSADAQPLFVASGNGQVLANRLNPTRSREMISDTYRPLLARAKQNPAVTVQRDADNFFLVVPVPKLRSYAFYLVDGAGIHQKLSAELGLLQLAEALFLLVVLAFIVVSSLRDAKARRLQQQLLVRKNEELEVQVRERTRELTRANEVLQRDLTLASSIQRALLVSERQLSRIAPDLDIGAVLVPSREVAGDLYDCIPLVAGRYLICVGDVSGKGIPAALLMSTCLSLVRAYSEVIDSPSAIMRRLNGRLSRNNPDCAFTTLFLAVLDCRTGELRYCNAGHNPSLLIRANGELERLAVVHGPATGVLPDTTYLETRLTMAVGDTLVAYTDGASEMFNPDRQRYGLDRMEAFLQANIVSASALLIRQLLRDLREFATDDSQNDDITVLAIRRHGESTEEEKAQQPGFSISLRGADLSVKQMRAAVSDYCKREQVNPRAQRHIKVIVDELLSNMLLHATAIQGQDLTVGLQLNRSGNELLMVFTDNGQAFNPLEADAPDLTASLEERQIGGLGLHIVRQLTTAQAYAREGGNNVLTLTIDLGAG